MSTPTSIPCPGCGRTVPMRAGDWKAVVECRDCGAHVWPQAPGAGDSVAAGLPRQSQGLSVEEDYPELRPRPPVVLIALAIAAVLGVVVVVILLMSAGQKENTKQARGANQAKDPSTQAFDEFVARQDAVFERSIHAVSFFTSLYCVLGLLYLASLCLMVAWVARDARNRGVDDVVFWVFLVVTAHMLGLVAYFAYRPSGVLVPCSACGNRRLGHAKACPHCGQVPT